MVYVLTTLDNASGTNIPLAVFNTEEMAICMKKKMEKNYADIEKDAELRKYLQINAHPNSIELVKVEGLRELQKLQETIDAIRASGKPVYVVND